MMSAEPPVIGRARRAVKMNILKLNGDYRERKSPDNYRTLVSIEPFLTLLSRAPICDGRATRAEKNELL